MTTRKKRSSQRAKAELRVGWTRRPSGKKVSGLDEVKKAHESHIHELGLTKKEYVRRQRLRLEMDVLLQIGASRDPQAIITVAALHDAAPLSPRVRRKYERLFRRASKETTQEEHGTVLAGLYLLEDFFVTESVAPLPSGKPSAKEFCAMCNLRMERRYLRPIDKDTAGKSVQVNFRSGYVGKRRERAIRQAWALAQKIGMDRTDFVKHAVEILKCSKKTVYRYTNEGA
jgi:hypothetical protein